MSSGLGLVKHDFESLSDLHRGFDSVRLKKGVWWIRRYGKFVYSEHVCSHDIPSPEYPVGSHVRIAIDMEKGEATYFLKGDLLSEWIQVPHKSTGISGPVYPCFVSYLPSEDGPWPTCSATVVHMKRTG